jgi:hypothetical protein
MFALLYRHGRISWSTLLIAGAFGCHQESALPTSLIPLACRITVLATVNEAVRDTTTHVYNAFGLVQSSTYRRWAGNQLTYSLSQTFTYADYYLIAQVDQLSTLGPAQTLTRQTKGYRYAYQNDRLQQVTIYDNITNVGLGSRTYTYEGNTLKSCIETDGSQQVIRRYTLDGAGNLMSYEEPKTGVAVLVTGGKIAQRTFPDNTRTVYEYDREGQLIREARTVGDRTFQYTYAYDTNPHWAKTQLRLRGIPTPDPAELPQVHNLKQSTYQILQGGKEIGEQKLIYNHQYNKQGYSLGFGRSDGMRQANYYTNCP